MNDEQMAEEIRSHLNFFLADVKKDGTLEGQIRIGADYASAVIATIKGHIRRELTGAYEAMMELSMYVGEEEWDSAQRHIRPASRRVSIEDAQAYTVAAYVDSASREGATEREGRGDERPN